MVTPRTDRSRIPNEKSDRYLKADLGIRRGIIGGGLGLKFQIGYERTIAHVNKGMVATESSKNDADQKTLN